MESEQKTQVKIKPESLLLDKSSRGSGFFAFYGIVTTGAETAIIWAWSLILPDSELFCSKQVCFSVWLGEK